MRGGPLVVVVLLVSTLLVAAAAGTAGTRIERPPTLEQLWERPGEDVGMVQGTSEYVPVGLRISFLVVRHDGKAVERPTARFWIARSRDRAPFASTIARLEPVGAPGVPVENGDVAHIYVAHVRVPAAGRYWVVAEPVGGKAIQALGNVDVARTSATPAVGARAIASRTPTLASTGGDVRALTTRVPPDRALLRYSVAGSLRAHVPFVLVFATPKYCTSRTCGPVVDVVDSVRRRYERRGIRFIHVEIYRDNNPAKGPNPWVGEWRLPSEPWTFLVGRDGRVKAKFEGSVSADELAAAVQARLVR